MSDARELLELYERAPLTELGALADAERRERHPGDIVTFIVDRNSNYTNVCVADCRFCAFYRRPRHPEGYVLSFEEIGKKIDEAKAIGAVQMLLQGGHRPYIPFEWYLDLLRHIKTHHPTHVHGFSPSEVQFFAKRFRVTIDEVIGELAKAGLDSIPGGGEILVDRVRRLAAPKKSMTDDRLGVMDAAHRHGMRTSATMMYGLGETKAERIESILRLRAQQATSGGFTAFISWPLQPEHTEMADSPKTDAVSYLRMLAIARLALDNFQNLQASWVTMGLKIGQIALRFGANDFGSVMLEENVVSAAGTTYRTSVEEMEALIRGAGFTPVRRRQDYSLIREAA